MYDSDIEHRSCSHCFAIVKTGLNTDAVVAELKTDAAAEPNTDDVEAELRTDAIESSTDEAEEEGCTKEKAASIRRLHQGEGCTIRVNSGVVDMVVVVIPSNPHPVVSVARLSVSSASPETSSKDDMVLHVPVVPSYVDIAATGEGSSISVSSSSPEASPKDTYVLQK